MSMETKSNTSVDDMMIKMIEPKMKEIENKFSNGGVLSQEDINTLLLKSQFNHINHLDARLDEVSSNVANLVVKFQGLEGKFQGLEGKFNLLESSFNLLRSDLNGRFDAFEAKIELKISQAINGSMRWSIGLIAFLVTGLKLADMFIK